jgi:hypothetical protein
MSIVTSTTLNLIYCGSGKGSITCGMALKGLMFQMHAHANVWFVTMMGLLNKTFVQPTQEFTKG